MNIAQKAARFAKLHVRGNPLSLYNAWDAGSAKAILSAGAKAVATSSWSVAKAQGYDDGEDMPIDVLVQIVGRIAAVVDAPVSVDFEGGYTTDDDELAGNVSCLLDLGVVGINFEDRVVRGRGLYPIDRQARRIAAIRGAAQKSRVKLFINARTDVFFQSRDAANSIGDALDRARAYAAAGASGFFVPGLKDGALIGRICEDTELPVNVMVMEGIPTVRRLAKLGVARVSYGPIPFARAMETLAKQARKFAFAATVVGERSRWRR